MPLEIILIGDTGKPRTDGKDPVLNLLRRHLPRTPQGIVVFLGDIIYPKGLPPASHPERPLAEARLRAQLEVFEAGYTGRVLFIPGNHDYKKGERKGHAYALRMEKYIEEWFGTPDVYLPNEGLPGPAELVLRDDLRLLALNTQWWMQGPKNRHAFENNPPNEEAFLKAVTERLREHHAAGRQVVVVAHQPLYSDALHGGRFRKRDHLFPLRMWFKNAWLPLPGIGTAITMWRKHAGPPEDLSHHTYRRLIKGLTKALAEAPGTVYAAGHEHNLQYIQRADIHHVVSGAGSKVAYVRPGGYSQFARAGLGFFKLLCWPDGRQELQCWVPGGPAAEGICVFQQELCANKITA